MKPYPHQIEKAEACWEILKSKGYVYLAGKPRSGKTLTALLIAEKSSSKVSNVIILTTKKAIPGWERFLSDTELGLTKNYTVTNYEQVGRITGNKYNMKLDGSNYQLAIIDESHNLG